MTMYLPNRDVRPTGQEAAEFIEAHRAGSPGDAHPAAGHDHHLDGDLVAHPEGERS